MRELRLQIRLSEASADSEKYKSLALVQVKKRLRLLNYTCQRFVNLNESNLYTKKRSTKGCGICGRYLYGGAKYGRNRCSQTAEVASGRIRTAGWRLTVACFTAELPGTRICRVIQNSDDMQVRFREKPVSHVG